jgi:hypothetical protein
MKIKSVFYRINILVIVAISIFLVACQWETIELPPAEPVIIVIPPGEVLSFAKSVEPIFIDAGCTDCHNSSTASAGLNLDTGKAWASLTKDGRAGGMVDTINPEISIIYTEPLKATSPQHYKKYSNEQAAYVLQWIKDGALNN